MKKLLIAGGGKFGKKAIKYAKKLNYKTILIDKDPNCYASNLINKKYVNLMDLLRDFEDIPAGEMIFFNADISTIYEILLNIEFDYIIPVVPIHLTATIVQLCFNSFKIKLEANSKLVKIYKNIIKKELFLNSIEDSGLIYLSYAKQDEVCPDDCSGPLDYCPNFKRKKPITITEYLIELFETSKTINISEKRKVGYFLIKSYQLISGLGGMKGSDIDKIISKIIKNRELFKKFGCNIIVSTSCNCHGVITFLKI